MTLDQAGFAVIVNDNTKTYSLITIKKRTFLNRLNFNYDQSINHDNIVNLSNIFKKK